MTYKIYQLKKEYFVERFGIPMKWVGDRFGKIDLEKYNLVYQRTKCTNVKSINTFLEDLFYVFNMDRPEDFTGHSMSVSDIVEVNGEFYYCDSFGWEKINL